MTPEAYKKAKTSAFARLGKFNKQVVDARKPGSTNTAPGGVGTSSQARSIDEDAVWAPKDLDLQRSQPPAGLASSSS